MFWNNVFWLLGSVLGGNCSVPRHGMRCSREAQKGSDTKVVLQFSALWAAAAPILGGSSALVQAEISFLGSVCCTTRWCCIYLHKSKELPFRLWVHSGRIVEANTVVWYPAETTVAFAQVNSNKNFSWNLILLRFEHVLTLGTCITSFSASLIVMASFIKYLSTYLNFPIHFWACAFLGSQFLF